MAVGESAGSGWGTKVITFATIDDQREEILKGGCMIEKCTQQTKLTVRFSSPIFHFYLFWVKVHEVSEKLDDSRQEKRGHWIRVGLVQETFHLAHGSDSFWLKREK